MTTLPEQLLDDSTKERREELGALAVRILPDGRELALLSLIFNFRLIIGKANAMTYDDGYCYDKKHPMKAFEAFSTWDGNGEPEGWIKHIRSGRFRPDGDPDKEYVQGAE